MENSRLYESAREWFDLELKDYVWYFDTPEQRFKYTSGSIWIINPNTKEWAFELTKSGHLWYFHYIRNDFLELFPINDIEFEEIVKLWVEYTFKSGVSTTECSGWNANHWVEDVLKRGVTTTESFERGSGVEDVLKRGVSTTSKDSGWWTSRVEDALKRGVSINVKKGYASEKWLDDVIEIGVPTLKISYQNL